MQRAVCAVQLTGLKIAYDTAIVGVMDLFEDECPKCHAAGIVTCPRCKGSKSLRSRPTRIVRNGKGRKMLLHHAHEITECWQCGPVVVNDFNLMNADMDEDRAAVKFIDNWSAAAAGTRMPNLFAPTAGTVLCPGCHGGRWIGRNDPNLDRFTVIGMPDLWYRVRHRLRTIALAVAHGVRHARMLSRRQGVPGSGAEAESARPLAPRGVPDMVRRNDRTSRRS